jgi:N6-adenosine-specific RNA methylase IME4
MARLKLGQYRVILADWPANFDTYSKKGAAKSPQRHYPTMSLAEVCALPIGALAAPDCALFFWATWPRIFDAQVIMRRWGFKYSGLAWEWFKYNFDTEKFAFGPGYGTRKNLEPCLLAKRGSPQLLSRSERDFIFAKRREHSRKPEEQYAPIERMYAGPRIEVFARQRRPGWDAWGNQLDKFSKRGTNGKAHQ